MNVFQKHYMKVVAFFAAAVCGQLLLQGVPPCQIPGGGVACGRYE
jgi:hypothetical protein